MLIKTMEEMLGSYLRILAQDELSEATISKYSRDIHFFLRWASDRQATEFDKGDIIQYKTGLLAAYKNSTVNSYLTSLNRYLLWLNHEELVTKTVRLQHVIALDDIVSGDEYYRLLRYCITSGRQRDYMLLRTIASTGIRVGELKYMTYETAASGSVEIYHKNKSRLVLLPDDLSCALLGYCSDRGITHGVIFTGRDKQSPISPKSVWKLFKRIAAKAGVDIRKVYPHSLRHLFAKTYMQKIGNIMELADLLGHSSIETTRIYAVTSREEKRKSLNSLGL